MSDSFSPIDCSPPGSSVLGILQAKTLSGLLLPSPSDLPDPGINPHLLNCKWSLALQADDLPPEPPGKMPYSNSGCTNLPVV